MHPLLLPHLLHRLMLHLSHPMDHPSLPMDPHLNLDPQSHLTDRPNLHIVLQSHLTVLLSLPMGLLPSQHMFPQSRPMPLHSQPTAHQVLLLTNLNLRYLLMGPHSLILARMLILTMVVGNPLETLMQLQLPSQHTVLQRHPL